MSRPCLVRDVKNRDDVRKAEGAEVEPSVWIREARLASALAAAHFRKSTGCSSLLAVTQNVAILIRTVQPSLGATRYPQHRMYCNASLHGLGPARCGRAY
jgi:hypothetical protein